MGTARRRRGSVETAFERAVGLLRREGRLTPADGALVAAGRASARLVDDAAASGTVWMREAALRRHVETLRELAMTPGTRGQVGDPLDDSLAAFFAADDDPLAPIAPNLGTHNGLPT